MTWGFVVLRYSLAWPPSNAHWFGRRHAGCQWHWPANPGQFWSDHCSLNRLVQLFKPWTFLTPVSNTMYQSSTGRYLSYSPIVQTNTKRYNCNFILMVDYLVKSLLFTHLLLWRNHQLDFDDHYRIKISSSLWFPNEFHHLKWSKCTSSIHESLV
jgi:hypothetical protein